MRTSLLLILAVLTVGTAHATPPTADDHARAGAEALAKKKANVALVEFVLAFAADSRPERLLGVAQALEASKQKAAAIELYERVLATGQGVTAATAQERLIALGAMKPVAPTTLSLTVMPPGAEVFLDGAAVGRAPLGVQTIVPGTHRIELRLPGYQAFAQEILAAAGQQIALVVTLVPGASGTAPVTAPPVTAPPVTAPVAAPPSLTPAVPAASTGLAGAWFGAAYSENTARQKRSLTMKLAGQGQQVTGELFLTSTTLLPAHKRAQCAGATELTTTTRFRARYSGSAETGTLYAEAPAIAACSCEGHCSAEDGFSLAIRLSPRGSVMAGEDYFFQRYDGGAVPALIARSLDGGAMAGSWTVHVSGVAGRGKATLKGAAGELGGSMTLARSVQIQSWRKNECGGKDTADATFRYKVSGDGDTAIDLEFKGDKWETCSCAEGACASAAAAAGIDDETAYWTLDGNHIVGSKVLLVRD
ncbi:MAG: PEGA domain-containing protein [Myxococcales bacterium]|nr:PEGA domain-containing protein [Myxococcales bacterium]